MLHPTAHGSACPVRADAADWSTSSTGERDYPAEPFGHFEELVLGYVIVDADASF